MNSFSSLTLGVGLLAALLGLTHASQAQSITTFDVPQAVDTFPQASNAFGKITGYSIDTSRSLHGFVRSPFGAITSFDAPAAGDPGTDFGTVAAAINIGGQIAGDVSGVRAGVFISRGFVREASGMITEFDAAADALRTQAQAINLEGWVAGIYFDTAFVGHGYVRLAHGAITTFDVPGFIIAVREIRPNGEVIGAYLEANGFLHGFVREPDGTLTSFEAPDASPATGGVFCGHCSGTFVTAANAAGRAVGVYGDAAHVVHGFLRKPGGAFSILDVPGAIRTNPTAINLESDVAGSYFDGTPSTHGFVLPRNGAFESFQIAGSNNLSVTGIGLDREVIGSYVDSSGNSHGFVRTPRAACGHFRP